MNGSITSVVESELRRWGCVCNRQDNIDIDYEAVRPAARVNVEKSLGWIVEGCWNGEDRLS